MFMKNFDFLIIGRITIKVFQKDPNSMLKKGIVFIVFIFSGFLAQAQDPQFSQFYAAPLYLNPAFAGTAMMPRVTLNYRNQWPSLSANFVTYSASADLFSQRFNSGLGLLLTNDRQFSNLVTTDIAAIYSYHLKINDEISANLGVQGSYVSRGIDFGDYTFGEQIRQYLTTGAYPPLSSSIDPIVSNGTTPRLNYADFSTGAMVYSDKFWAGVSVHHLNQPNQSFNDKDARLPMKVGIQAGYRIPLADYLIGNNLGDAIDREKSLTPAIHYKRQGNFDQLDAGIYLTYAPLVLGAWYRGIPLKSYTKNGEKILSHDAAIILLGYRQDNFSIGYSYDATISSLGSTGGAHEISLSYTFSDILYPQPRNHRNKKEISCPKF
jgi:type IX secretion system PorP/SprF family membrane protein